MTSSTWGFPVVCLSPTFLFPLKAVFASSRQLKKSIGVRRTEMKSIQEQLLAASKFLGETLESTDVNGAIPDLKVLEVEEKKEEKEAKEAREKRKAMVLGRFDEQLDEFATSLRLPNPQNHAN